jgi:hypothetical protein
VERLVNKLLSAKYDGPNDLWRFQEGLLALQRDIQEAITEAKRSRTDKVHYSRLRSLRMARWHARRLGDAFAWVLLGQDRKVIHSLDHNARVSVSQANHGTRGLLAVASHLASQGWGFPLLHDVTDCLRIGDVTFIVPGKKPHEYKTVEVKTRIKSEKRSEDGKTTYEYEVTVLSPAEFHDPPGGALDAHTSWEGETTAAPNGSQGRAANPRYRRRVDRQLLRMSKARKRQLAEHGSVVELDGEAPVLTTHFESEASSHWKPLRRIIRNARRTGYASVCVDGAFLYTAFYRPDGVNEDALKDSTVAQDLLDSDIFFRGIDRGRNALVVTQVPPREAIGAQPFLPYFLYTIPKRAIFDLLHGRLTIIVLTNSGRIVSALEEDGFHVSLPSGRNDLSAGSLVISAEVMDDQGGSYRVDMHDMSFHVLEIIHEFKGLHYFVEVARSTRDAARTVIAQQSKAEALRNR